MMFNAGGVRDPAERRWLFRLHHLGRCCARCDGGSASTDDRSGRTQSPTCSSTSEPYPPAPGARRVVHLLLGHALVDAVRRLVLRVAPHPPDHLQPRSGALGSGGRSRPGRCCDVDSARRGGTDGGMQRTSSPYQQTALARMSRIVSTCRYKRPPRKRKTRTVEAPAVVTIDPKTRLAKKGRRPVRGQAAAKVTAAALPGRRLSSSCRAISPPGRRRAVLVRTQRLSFDVIPASLQAQNSGHQPTATARVSRRTAVGRSDRWNGHRHHARPQDGPARAATANAASPLGYLVRLRAAWRGG